MKKIIVFLFFICLLSFNTKTEAVVLKHFNSKITIYNNYLLPYNYRNISLFGEPELSCFQAVIYLKKNNKFPKIQCSVEELVNIYWQEASVYGIRPDIAFCQAILETGYFRYGGDVGYHQNNFCGLGATGNKVPGYSFESVRLGVRAHIQHLLCYGQRKVLKDSEIVDPRYELAYKVHKGLKSKWIDLNGTWATGSNYCEKIMWHYVRMSQI